LLFGSIFGSFGLPRAPGQHAQQVQGMRVIRRLLQDNRTALGLTHAACLVMCSPSCMGLIDRQSASLEEEPKGDDPCLQASWLQSLPSVPLGSHLSSGRFISSSIRVWALSISACIFLQRGLFVCGGLGQFVHSFSDLHPSAQLFQIRFSFTKSVFVFILARSSAHSFTMEIILSMAFS